MRHRASALELELKRVVNRHPEAHVLHESPSGPFVRAVLWGAGDEGEIVGQTYWCTDSSRWVTRAFDTRVGESSVVVEHPDRDGLADSITRVVDRLRRPEVEQLGQGLAAIVAALRTGT